MPGNPLEIQESQISYWLRAVATQGREFQQNALIAARIPAWRSKFLVAMIGFLFCGLLGQAFFVATNPLLKMQAQMVTANLPMDSLTMLVYQTDRLNQLTKKIDNVSVAALRSAMEESVRAANLAAVDFRAQSNAWSDLRGKIKDDTSTYDALRAQLAEVQRLQKDEIVRLKQMLDDAQRPSILADAWNLFLSFVLGVVGSFLASGLYERWRARRATAG